MALIRDEKNKYLCSETDTISSLGLELSFELSLFLKSLVTSYQLTFIKVNIGSYTLETRLTMRGLNKIGDIVTN